MSLLATGCIQYPFLIRPVVAGERADEQYYRVGLGPLHPLAHPIPSRSWKRITFIVTHWAQIVRAWDVSDLLEENALERGLWSALDKLRAVRDEEEEW